MGCCAHPTSDNALTFRRGRSPLSSCSVCGRPATTFRGGGGKPGASGWSHKDGKPVRESEAWAGEVRLCRREVARLKRELERARQYLRNAEAQERKWKRKRRERG